MYPKKLQQTNFVWFHDSIVAKRKGNLLTSSNMSFISW